MHELGIAARILDVALARAAGAGTAPITDLHLEIGPESGVAPGSIELYWPQVSRATRAEGARLHIRPGDGPRLEITDAPGARIADGVAGKYALPRHKSPIALHRASRRSEIGRKSAAQHV